MENPLLNAWNTPYSTPPFSSINDRHYAPAIREAISMARQAISQIAGQQDPPTFHNTIVALETATDTLDRATALLFNLNECNTNDTLQQTVLELTPEITRFENSIWMNRKLFDRVKQIHDKAEDLDGEQQELLDKYYQRFVRNGVALDGDAKQQFAANAEQLSLLSEQFNQNALNDTNGYTLHITDPALLSGLPDSAITAAREEAGRHGKQGWLFTLHAPSYRPFITYADHRDLRQQMWQAYNTRGNRNNGNNNTAIIHQIVNLRLRQAQLLGFDDYASYSLSRTMAQNRDNVTTFLNNLLEACLPFAKNDLKQVSRFAKQHGADYQLQNWDFAYWSEKLKQELYNIDSEALRPYFQLASVLQGIFNLYNRLYGIRFVASGAIETYHPDVMAYEVRDNSRLMGILYLDLLSRNNKRSGAWMTEFRPQSNINGVEQRPLIQVVCNFAKPTADKPSLLTFDELETLMHEMGHAMHGLLSDVRYPSISGTSVRHDFVEMPSQLMENWCYQTEFLNTFALHYQTRQPLPSHCIDSIRRSEQFLAGWLCLRQLNFGLTDMAYHTITSPLDDGQDIADFEHAAMVELMPVVGGCCTSTAFTHIFSGSYAAGYYGYKWAEVLDADIFSRFQSDGIFNSGTATAFRREILSRGGAAHPSVLFRNFMGRDPDNHAFLRRSGFLPAQ